MKSASRSNPYKRSAKFSTVNAEIVMFHATTVRSPPLSGQENFVMVSGVEEIDFVVDENELNGLLNEYLI